MISNKPPSRWGSVQGGNASLPGNWYSAQRNPITPRPRAGGSFNMGGGGLNGMLNRMAPGWGQKVPELNQYLTGLMNFGAGAQTPPAPGVAPAPAPAPGAAPAPAAPGMDWRNMISRLLMGRR